MDHLLEQGDTHLDAKGYCNCFGVCCFEESGVDGECLCTECSCPEHE